MNTNEHNNPTPERPIGEKIERICHCGCDCSGGCGVHDEKERGSIADLIEELCIEIHYEDNETSPRYREEIKERINKYFQ
jgi:hypothetical protein